MMDINDLYDGIYKDNNNKRYLIDAHKLYDNQLNLITDENQIQNVLFHVQPWITMNRTFAFTIFDEEKNENVELELCYYMYDFKRNQIVSDMCVDCDWSINTIPDDTQTSVRVLEYYKKSYIDILSVGNMFFRLYPTSVPENERTQVMYLVTDVMMDEDWRKSKLTMLVRREDEEDKALENHIISLLALYTFPYITDIQNNDEYMKIVESFCDEK